MGCSESESGSSNGETKMQQESDESSDFQLLGEQSANQLGGEETICYHRRITPQVGQKRRRIGNGSGDYNPEYGLGLRFDRIRELKGAHLRTLLAELTAKQREAVKAIGFGGILDFKCDALPNQMNEWLIQSFNPVSQNFEVGKVRFALSGLDARRVFGLNYAPGQPVLYSPHAPDVASFITGWKKQYCDEGGEEIDYYSVIALIRRHRSGGDDFKRLFVLFFMKGFLTPEFGTDLELGLLRSLMDVDRIREMNWAGFVVEHLCDTLFGYKQRSSTRGCEGCLLLLQITYFHSCIWKGEAPLTEEPYIKHWYGTKIGERVVDEIQSGGFGKGWFIKNNQTRSLHYSSPLPQKLVNSSNAGTKMELDVPLLRDDEISLAIEDEGCRKAWNLLRDIEKLINCNMESGRLHGFELREGCLTKIGNNKIEFDARRGFDRVLINLFSVCWYMNPCMSNTINNLLEESLGVVDPDGVGSSSTPVMGSPWNAWVFNYPATYSCLAVRKCCLTGHNFAPYKLEVADFCVARDAAVDEGETLFSDGGDLTIQRIHFSSMDVGEVVHSAMVNVFARLLNYEWSKTGISSRVCFDILAIGDDDSASEDAIMKQWRAWINKCNLQLRDAAFVLIPVAVGKNYYLVVINFMDCKIQCIEPTANADGETVCERKTRLLGAAFRLLLEFSRDERADVVETFVDQRLTPHWSTCVSESDSGVCVMNMMERFCGSAFALDVLRLNEEQKLIQLRVAYVCYMALSNLNAQRSYLLEKIPSFMSAKNCNATNP